MLKKKILGIFFLCAILVLGTSPAFGAPFLFGDEVQLLEDQDAEVLMDSAGNERTIGPGTTIDVGDLFGGIFKIQFTENVPSGDNNVNLQGPTDTFTAIFLIKTLGISSDGGPADGSINNSDDILTFGAASQTDWNNVFGAGKLMDISSIFDVSDLDGMGTGLATGTMSMLLDGVNYDDADLSPTPGATYSDSTLTFVTTPANTKANLLYEFGFTGGGGTAAANQFWYTSGKDAEFPALVGTNNPINRLALDLTMQWAGPNLVSHNFLGTNAPFDLNFTGLTDIQGKGDFAGAAQGPWGIVTDTDLYIHAVPEPATMLLFGTGLIGLAGIGRRRFFKK